MWRVFTPLCYVAQLTLQGEDYPSGPNLLTSTVKSRAHSYASGRRRKKRRESGRVQSRKDFTCSSWFENERVFEKDVAGHRLLRERFIADSQQRKLVLRPRATNIWNWSIIWMSHLKWLPDGSPAGQNLDFDLVILWVKPTWAGQDFWPSELWNKVCFKPVKFW